ncbi:DUF2326 domain-containing protein [Desulfovibrio intestinalis]|uniref:Uncharacterized protein YydD (DUF2326 family) n=1 Tax=Desulfovibrio intestinalis TaxID=58621 RepID=A0A7W8C3P0_9BACT|nr:DUF2326 domain-containing protein [Desulfovibrio intestinalis]MBB5143115.1 uncharacterized protein YydD (DUF2326 family) [Desulfovibrio intestinalis]
MIKKIYASDKRFKAVEFQKGLNVIIAERVEGSGEKDTRNGAGKTTLINIIHFCLGADVKKLGLPYAEIEDWDFYIDITICGKNITAKRSIKKANYIIVSGATDDLPIFAEKDADSGELFYKNDDWKKLLGLCLFNLHDGLRSKYKPSFRSLISYFIRRGVDAYSHPFTHFRNQKTFDFQINNAYLLGLNWEHASEAQEIRDKSSALKALSSAVKAGIVSSQGELEAERVRLEKTILEENKAIETFKVLPQYKELQDRANLLTTKIHHSSNNLLVLRRKLTRYEESIATETPPEGDSVEKLYAEAGMFFSESIKKTLGEAKTFHASVIENRKKFLQTELAEIKNKIIKIENDINSSTDERAKLMRLLQTHGALEEFSLLQTRVVEKQERLETVKTKLSELKNISNEQKEIKARKLELDTKLQRDYELSRPNWEQAVALFNEGSLALYDEPGNLIINTTENGYEFDVEISRSNSEGVGKMKIFCYDMMLVELLAEKNGIDFLIHDSTIYDGVDSRQRAHALQYACSRAEEHDFQYICALNSDMVPYDDFENGFDLCQFVRLTLGDKNPSDSLMGFHFELKKEVGRSPE